MRYSRISVLGILLLVVTSTAWADLDPDSPTVLITGSNRGIGLGFVQQYAERGWNVVATCRSPEKADQLKALADKHDQVVIEQLDVTDFDRIDALAAQYQSVDILISNAGLTPKYKTAFRRVSGIDWDMARRSMEVNAIAPLKLAQAFMDSVAASEQKKMIMISSKAGSFGISPKMPMLYSYRTSKTALNMYMYTLAFETPKKGVILTLLSPGQVNTIENPEQYKGIKIPNTIEVEESVAKMLKVIDGLTPEDNGKFLDYEDGSVLPW